MNDVEEAKSSSALASETRPSGDTTATRHVISNKLDLMPTVACDDAIGAVCNNVWGVVKAVDAVHATDTACEGIGGLDDDLGFTDSADDDLGASSTCRRL